MERNYAVMLTIANKAGDTVATVGPAYFRTEMAVDLWILRQMRHYEAQGFFVSWRIFETTSPR